MIYTPALRGHDVSLIFGWVAHREWIFECSAQNTHMHSGKTHWKVFERKPVCGAKISFELRHLYSPSLKTLNWQKTNPAGKHK